MKKFGTRQLVPVLAAVIGIVFAFIGFTQLRFWNGVDGPQPGFFPSIMAIVMVLSSILAFVQSLKEDEKTKYEKDELLVVAGGAGIFAGSFIIGLLPTCYLFVVLWLKIFEKETWKNTLVVLAIIAAITIGVFYIWLGIQFPMGLFENFM